ncbi:unnamed protein product [Periconia digitata]|uniref:Uncharacterized protein n=1 Tax=Periconia digitata TaxID=1303443 RepID=A0A9W4U3P0_9PLEO|nr:unnamed protein product [Periconia digitata]
MPRYIPPKQLTEHRTAAIALYRALLSRCTSAPLSAEDRSSLRNAICKKFRRSRKLQSSHQLGLVFQAGYKTLSYLDASTSGNTASTNALRSIISNLPSGITRTRSFIPSPSSSSSLTATPSKNALACLPSKQSTLDVRPYAKVSGPRHVPILASANGIPFLRLGKPQSPVLSRTIRYKLKSRIERFDSKVVLSNYWFPIASQEDVWDTLLEEHCELKDETNTSITWVGAIEQAIRQETMIYEADLADDRALRQKMMGIVDAETKLAEQEGQIVTRGRKSRPIQARWLM